MSVSIEIDQERWPRQGIRAVGVLVGAMLLITFAIGSGVVLTSANAQTTTPDAGNSSNGNNSTTTTFPNTTENSTAEDQPTRTNASTQASGNNSTTTGNGSQNGSGGFGPVKTNNSGVGSGDGNTTGSGDGNTTGNSSGGSLIGGFGPGPWEWVSGVISGFNSAVMSQIADFANRFNAQTIGIPTRGVLTDISSLANADEGYWTAFDPIQYVCWAVAILGLILYIGKSFSKEPAKRHSAVRRIIIGGTMIVGAPWIPQAGYILTDTAVMEIVPSGAEFTSSWGNMAKLGLGIILLGVLLGLSSGTIVIGLFIAFMFNMAVYITWSVWPIMWLLWIFEGQLRGYGKMGINGYGVLLVTPLIQAILSRALFNIPWTEGAMGPLSAMLGIMAGLTLVYTYLPYVFAKYATSSASVSSGIESARNAGEHGKHAVVEAPQTTKQVVNQVNEVYSTIRNEESPREVGTVNNTSVNNGMVNTTGGSGNDPSINGLDAQEYHQQSSQELNRARDRINRGFQ